MANFFQPGPSQAETSTTPSPASQAEQKFRVEMLGRILAAMAGTAPSFASFAKGGPAQRAFPGGFEGNIASLLAAMNEPGAFTSTASQTGQGPTPSGISDVSQLATLAYLISQATGFSLSDILRGVGGPLGIGGTNPALGNAAPSSDFLESLPFGDQPGVNFTPAPSYWDSFGDQPGINFTPDPSQGMSELPPDWSWLDSY